MSSILKALKRLDEERQRASRRTEDLQLTSAILQERPQKPAGITVMLVRCCGAGALFVAGAAMVYLLQRPTVPPASLPVVKPVADRPAAIPPSQASERHETIPDATARLPQADRPANTTPPRARTAPTATDQTSREQAPVATPAPQRHSLLRVVGIAYQADDTTSSIAVVNGNAVRVGHSVEGARVEEILKDRVRFSRGDERFEVPLSR